MLVDIGKKEFKFLQNIKFNKKINIPTKFGVEKNLIFYNALHCILFYRISDIKEILKILKIQSTYYINEELKIINGVA